MKKVIVLLLMFMITITACKKKDNPSKSTTTGSTTTSGTTGTGTFTNATSFSGFLLTIEATSTLSGYPSSASANFYATPQSGNASPGIEIGSLLYNGQTLNFSNGMYMNGYQQTIDFNTENWTVNGNSTIPTFTIADGGRRPAGLNTSAFPTTVSKAAGLNFNLGTLSNVKSASFILTDGTPTGQVTLYLYSGNNQIQVTPAQLANFTKTSNGSINLMISNYQGIHILGKNFDFVKSASVYRQIAITD